MHLRPPTLPMYAVRPPWHCPQSPSQWGNTNRVEDLLWLCRATVPQFVSPAAIWGPFGAQGIGPFHQLICSHSHSYQLHQLTFSKNPTSSPAPTSTPTLNDATVRPSMNPTPIHAQPGAISTSTLAESPPPSVQVLHANPRNLKKLRDACASRFPWISPPTPWISPQ